MTMSDLSDPVFDDMGMSDIAERQKFLELCRKSFHARRTRDVNFREWEVCVSLVVQMCGLTKVLESVQFLTHDSPTNSFVSPDEDGKVVEIDLSLFEGPKKIPAGIHRLDRLKVIIIFDVESLPLKELSLLPHLEELHISSTDSLSDSFRGLEESVKLRHLKTLCINKGVSSFELLHRCTSLENIGFVSAGESESYSEWELEFFIDMLCSDNFISAETLKSLYLDFFYEDTLHFETFLFEILPKFPKLYHLMLPTKTLHSTKAIVKRLRSNEPFTISKSLRRLSFGRYFRSPRGHIASYENSTWGHGILRDLDLIQVLPAFLEAFSNVEYIDFPFALYSSSESIHPDWKYALLINMAGRRLIIGSGD